MAVLVLTVAGGLYLIWLGFKTVPGAGVARCWREWRSAAARWPIPIQLAVLGRTFVGTCSMVCPRVGAGAQALLRARPAVSRVVSRISGASMILVGTLLVAERLVA
ncbi:hypothetical protein ACFWIW_07260 [Amycolatopsis sp. NPDC058340]|uniref:hypothetical protein n=1 Tax=Amycolatopsis sp. NPDC058340 TaxID=3346453 RepID=UPI003663AF94